MGSEWENSINDIISEISDIEFQRKNWFGESDIESSPQELYTQLLDDYRFEEFLALDNMKNRKEKINAGIKLKKELDGYKPLKKDVLAIEIFNDPKWNEIRFLAKKYLEL